MKIKGELESPAGARHECENLLFNGVDRKCDSNGCNWYVWDSYRNNTISLQV